jgi:hypothetical protein
MEPHHGRPPSTSTAAHDRVAPVEVRPRAGRPVAGSSLRPWATTVVSGHGGGWASYPGAPPPYDGHHRALLGDDGGTSFAAEVVGVGAFCTLRASADERSQGFDLSELLMLADGTRVVLHSDRGYTIGSPFGPVVEGLTATEIERDVLNVLIPDDDASEDEHEWGWLAELAAARGIEVTPEELRRLPYEVVLGDDVTAWLAEA